MGGEGGGTAEPGSYMLFLSEFMVVALVFVPLLLAVRAALCEFAGLRKEDVVHGGFLLGLSPKPKRSTET